MNISVNRAGVASMLIGLLYGATSLASEYIGAEQCRNCHEHEYAIWNAGPHASAHLSLTNEQLADARCNTCHTTPTLEDEVELTGVQCESCHGAGTYYQAAYVMRDAELARAVGLLQPTEEHCRFCHTADAPGVEPFDFKQAWARISHGKESKEHRAQP